MSKKKRDHASSENGFEEWVSVQHLISTFNIIFIHLSKLNFTRLFINKNDLHVISNSCTLTINIF